MENIRVIIKNFRCIKECNIKLNNLSFLIGSNGSGKSTIMEAIQYFYANLTHNKSSQDVFDQNNLFSNYLSITLIYDCNSIIKHAKKSLESMGNYDEYLNNIVSLQSKNQGDLKIELTQIKNKKIQWNVSYEIRALIESIFPLFFLDAHTINYFDWNTIWDMFADLNKISNSEKNQIIDEIKNVINGNSKISDKIDKTMSILDGGNIDIIKFTTKDFTKNLLYLYFSGNKFTKNKRELTYYSDGTTTINYLNIFLEIIDEISNTKMKKPIIIFDEPETSLHPEYVKDLADIFCNHATNTNILISTHSPRLVKIASIKMTNNNMNLYNIKINDNYTKVKKMKSISNAKPSEKFRILDEHINSYFSKGILFVEGESELELFLNEYLQILFPVLRKIDIFKAMTDDKILRNIDPNVINSWAPCLYLIDMDKVLKHDRKNNIFTLCIDKYIEKDKEKVNYFNKKNNDFDLRLTKIRLNEMAKNINVHYSLPFYACNDRNYHIFKYILLKYMLSYNYFVLETTIEGMLINYRTKKLYLEFLKRKRQQTYNDMIGLYVNKANNEKVNLLRMVTDGYSDLFYSLKSFEKENKTNKKIKKVLKTDGWITEFIAFCIERTTECTDVAQFNRYIRNPDNLKYVKTIFKNLFPELDKLIKKLYGMIDM